MIELYNTDALDKIQELSDRSVDHIITDIPYNISMKNNLSTMREVRQGVYFGEWDEGFDFLKWIPLYAKILNPDGSLIIFNAYRQITPIISECESNGLVLKDVIVWEKSNPMPRNRDRRYVQDKEFASWFVKDKAKWTFNKPRDIDYLRSIFRGSIVLGKEKSVHPTQKSLELMDRIIRIHTNKGDTVLDPFMGSGTTGVACVTRGRGFIGIEKNKKYFDIAEKRIKNSNEQTDLFC